MKRVLVTRAADRAARTEARLTALGHQAIMLPLFETVPLPWTMPEVEFDAVMLTSAAAATCGGNAFAALFDLPCYCVGEATAGAARAVGFTDPRVPPVTGVEGLLASIHQDGRCRVLHLCGRDVVETSAPAFELHRCAVYAAQAKAWSSAERKRAADAELALVYSARGGARLAEAIAFEARGKLAIAAISAAAAALAGEGWRLVKVASQPTEDALFAAAGLLCDEQGEAQSG